MPRPASGTAVRARAPGRTAAARTAASVLLQALAAPGDDLTLEVDGHAFAVTTLERVHWPGVAEYKQPPLTKRDFLRYLVRVADAMRGQVTSAAADPGYAGQRQMPGSFSAGWRKSTPVTSPSTFTSMPSSAAAVSPSTPPSDSW